MRYLRLLTFFFILAVARAQNPPAGTANVNEHMTIAEVENALQLNPPSPQNAGNRLLIAESLDKLIHFNVKKDLPDAQLEELKPLRDFYLRQVDRGLQALEKTNVTTGVEVFKFYSSSIILKASQGVIAIDFQQGPHVTYCGNPEIPDPVVQRTGFCWTSEQLDRLASQVDVYFITHPHADHADYELAKRVLARGKILVLPRQLKDLWPNLTGKIIVPAYNTIQQVGPVEMYAMDGCQYMENNKATKDAQGHEVGYPSTDPKIKDAETIVYLLKFGGLVFMQAGENNVPADQWLEGAIAKGFRPDVRMSVGMRQGARSVDEVLARTGPVFSVPVHEYELGHPNGGNRTAGLYLGTRAAQIAGNLSMPLFWGESYALTPGLFPWHSNN